MWDRKITTALAKGRYIPRGLRPPLAFLPPEKFKPDQWQVRLSVAQNGIVHLVMVSPFRMR